MSNDKSVGVNDVERALIKSFLKDCEKDLSLARKTIFPSLIAPSDTLRSYIDVFAFAYVWRRFSSLDEKKRDEMTTTAIACLADKSVAELAIIARELASQRITLIREEVVAANNEVLLEVCIEMLRFIEEEIRQGDNLDANKEAALSFYTTAVDSNFGTRKVRKQLERATVTAMNAGC